MIKNTIGIPKEIKKFEFRVGATPTCVKAYKKICEYVFVEAGAGIGSGFSDDEYAEAGATIVSTAKEAWNAEMVIKVKEPQPSEFQYFEKGKFLYTYLHLAAFPDLTEALVRSEMNCVGYETISENNSLVCLEPMSIIAGKLAAQKGSEYLLAPHGRGILMGGLPGIPPANVTIVGGGSVGTAAARVSIGMGANVTILDISQKRLYELENIFGNSVNLLLSNDKNIKSTLVNTDLLIGAVLIPGKKAPKLFNSILLNLMKRNSVFVDVAIDQGGCSDTSVPTTHDNPIYYKDNILHYCVANMPSVSARTSTLALTNSTLKYGLDLFLNKDRKCEIDKGWQINKNGMIISM
jgi:alanine dehydrogenase